MLNSSLDSIPKQSFEEPNHQNLQGSTYEQNMSILEQNSLENTAGMMEGEGEGAMQNSQKTDRSTTRDANNDVEPRVMSSGDNIHVLNDVESGDPL